MVDGRPEDRFGQGEIAAAEEMINPDAGGD
jgi:hypothetical protein